jgi:hypothetical protein
MLYNGIKTTGYSRFPYSANDKSDNGYALAIRGKSGVIELIIALNTNPTVAAPATYAIIERVAYDAVWEPGTVLYKVVGSTAAITNVGAYEVLADTSNPTYETGNIVNVQSDGSGGYKIVAVNGLDNGLRQYTTVSVNNSPVAAKSEHVVNHVNEYHEYFTVSTGIPAMGSTFTVTTANIPFLDYYFLTSNRPGLEAREYPLEGDVVELYFGTGAFGAQLEAIILTAHGDDVAAQQAAAKANVQAAATATISAAGTFDGLGFTINPTAITYGSSVALSTHAGAAGSTLDWTANGTDVNTAVVNYLNTFANTANSAAGITAGGVTYEVTVTVSDVGVVPYIYYGDPSNVPASQNWEDGDEYIGWYIVTITPNWSANPQDATMLMFSIQDLKIKQ